MNGVETELVAVCSVEQRVHKVGAVFTQNLGIPVVVVHYAFQFFIQRVEEHGVLVDVFKEDA